MVNSVWFATHFEWTDFPINLSLFNIYLLYILNGLRDNVNHTRMHSNTSPTKHSYADYFNFYAYVFPFLHLCFKSGLGADFMR